MEPRRFLAGCGSDIGMGIGQRLERGRRVDGFDLFHGRRNRIGKFLNLVPQALQGFLSRFLLFFVGRGRGRFGGAFLVSAIG